MKPTISTIAIMSQNRVIGMKNRIPWRIREDLIRFRDKTLGHVVIVGRKTFESLEKYYQKSGRPWPKRPHIIVTKNHHFKTSKPDCRIAHSFASAVKLAKRLEKEEIFIAGGAQIYAQALPISDKLYVTIVHTHAEGDAFFPDYSRFRKVVYQKECQNEKYRYTFLDLVPENPTRGVY